MLEGGGRFSRYGALSRVVIVLAALGALMAFGPRCCDGSAFPAEHGCEVAAAVVAAPRVVTDLGSSLVPSDDHGDTWALCVTFLLVVIAVVVAAGPTPWRSVGAPRSVNRSSRRVEPTRAPQLFDLCVLRL